MDKGKIILFGGVFALILAISAIGYFNVSNDTVVINNTNLQQNVTTDSNGNTHSETVLMVYTDNGAYEVYQEGFFAHPEYIGKINVGDTVQIESRFFNCPFLGVYRTITKLK